MKMTDQELIVALTKDLYKANESLEMSRHWEECWKRESEGHKNKCNELKKEIKELKKELEKLRKELEEN